jgi:hypothetical protein
MTLEILLPCDTQTLDALARSVAGGDAGETLSQLDAVIVRHPYDARLYLLRGSMLASVEAGDRARDDFTRATVLAPGLDEARFMLGQLEYTSGNPLEAYAIWAPFRVTDAGTSAVAHLGAAMLCLIDGDAAASRRHLETALTRSPGDAIRDHVERLLGQLGMETTAPTEPETGMPHFLLSDYLSGQTRH